MSGFDPQVREMTRSRGQILFRYRPHQTFDHPGGYTARVRQYGRDDAYQGFVVDPSHLIDEAIRFVARWRLDGSAPGAAPGSDRAPEYPAEGEPLARAHYEIVIPGKVFCRFWPLVFRCAKFKSCGRVWDERDEPEPGDQPWPPACPSCGNSAGNRQLQFVFVHPCGEVESMRPPARCENCHTRGFRLKDEASRFKDFRWECLECRATAAVRAFCSNTSCSWAEKMMSPQVHTASAAYVGHGRTLVNPPGEEFAKLTGRPEFAVATLGRWLQECDEDEYRRLLSAPGTGSVPAEILESIAAMEKAGLTLEAQKLRRRFVPAGLDEIRARVERALGFDPVSPRGAALAASVGVFDRVLHLPHTTLRRIEEHAATPARRARYAGYRGSLRAAGFDPERCMLIDEFPVTYLAVGYSRGGFSPREADLVAYKGRASQGQAERTLLFANPTRTEALVFALDRDRAARWLVVNGAAAEQDIAGASGVSRWFASQLDPADGQIPRWDPDTPLVESDRTFGPRLLFELLHSMAHQMLRAVAVDSGFSETALSEYLFPYDLAFAIHPNGGSEFTVGGLRTVLEQNLDEVVARAVENSSCLYDPNCMVANRGADHGCLQLPETACQAWNRFISRWNLYGSPTGQPPRVGYWSPELDGPTRS